MSPYLASSGSAEGWEFVDVENLPRHTFDRMIAFGAGESSECADCLVELVSLRNALTPTGSLLVVLGPGDVPDDLCDLAARAGFTRVRELARAAPVFSTLELKR
jgi:hypothetical protein